jgi:voltage-gated sodium channel
VEISVNSLSLRKRAGAWIESTPVQQFIIALIVINAVVLGLETAPAITARYGAFLKLTDELVLTVFVLEIGTKLFAFRLGFFRNPWNVFDFTVVAVALIPASGPLAILRALRVLRVLRLVSMVPRLRFVVEALLRAVPGILSIGALMLILFYVFAVMATGLFGGDFPQWFRSVGASMYTLFQIMTLESWSMGIVRPVMQLHPYAWVYFIPFILIATFTMLNLFIGIIVDTMQSMHTAEHTRDRDHIEEAVHTDTGEISLAITALRDEIRQLRAELKDQRIG